LEICKIPEEKVEVIYNGVDSRFRVHSPDEIQFVKRILALPERFVLCVGSIEPRKNLARLLQAWRLLQHELPGFELVLAGSTGSIFENAGVEVPPSGVRLIGYVKDELLPALYSASELFVYPSLYEGFGLPVIEAMASGVPVVTSTITSLPEIAGRAAELVDPFDIESIAQGIRNVVNNTNIQDRFINPGLERASQFTWDQTARATWQTLMEAAGN
jgi:glycosyltransferase involved in cell wall biosynthesis